MSIRNCCGISRVRSSSTATLLLALLGLGVPACLVSPEQEQRESAGSERDSADVPPAPMGELPNQSADHAGGAAAGEESVGKTSAALTSNGCSEPWYAEAVQQALHPFPGLFTTLWAKACDRHDYCYSSGKAFYGYSRENCDDAFLDGMLYICQDEIWEPISLLTCQTAAMEFYGFVRVLAASHYEGSACTAGQVNTEECSTHEPFESTAPISKDYIFYTLTGGGTYQRSGAPSAASKLIGTTATAMAGYAFRGGYLAGGTLRLREGDPDAAATFTTNDVSRFALSGNRVASLFTNGNFFFQSGGLGSAWTSGVGSAYNFALDQDRVLVATNTSQNGVKDFGLWLKKGSATSAWKRLNPVNAQLRQIDVAGSRIAVIYQGPVAPAVLVSDNDGSTWDFVNSTDGLLDLTKYVRPMDQMKLAGRRMGIHAFSDGTWNLWVTDDSLSSFKRAGNNVTSWDLLSNRLAMVTNGRVLLQDINSRFFDVGTAQSVKLSGNRVALLDGGSLYVKDGALSDSWTNRANWTLVASNVKDYAIWQKGDYQYADYVGVIQ